MIIDDKWITKYEFMGFKNQQNPPEFGTHNRLFVRSVVSENFENNYKNDHISH